MLAIRCCDRFASSGAQRAGDINGFENDLLHGLTFRNVTFETAPKQGWACGYVDLDTFSATDVSPMLKCAAGPSHVADSYAIPGR